MSRPAPLLRIRRSRPDPSGRERLACLVLAVLTCVLAHELSYHLRYGSGASYADAMQLWGHDSYWLGLTTGVALAVGILAWIVITNLVRLHREADGAPVVDDAGGARTLVALTGRTWLRLVVMATGLFAIQENLEAVLSGHFLPALAPLLGDGAVALLAIAAISLVVAVVVALARWRQLVLLGRLDAQARHWPPTRADRPSATTPRIALSRHLGGIRLMRAPPTRIAEPA
jgi:hypothetical protein